MEELKMKVQRLCELKDQLMSAAEGAMSQGCQNVNTHEMGAVVDMIKDLCEAEEKLWKAHYYKEICEAMEEAEEEEEFMRKMGMSGEEGSMGYRRGSHRMGYDNWRYASGRFAPTGHGHRSGYRPGEEIEPWMHAEGFGENPWDDMRGYDSTGTHHDSMTKSGDMGHANRMGYSGSERGHRYDQYTKARMGYHQSKDAAHKEHMDASARDYVVDVAETLKEMWKDSDPSMKKEMKNKLVELTGMMN